MKNILRITIALFALVAFANLANAQTNSGITPAIGTAHDYWVNSTDNGATQTSGTGNTFEWFLSKDAAGTTKLTNNDEFNVATSGYNVATSDLYKINILWKAASANEKYYLHVIETNPATGCSNHKAQVINPFSDFQLAIGNVNTTFTDEADNFQVCAPDVVLTEDATATSGVGYDYGTTKLYYKVDAMNIGKEDFEFNYQIDIAAAYAGNPAVATIGTVSAGVYANENNLTVGGEQTITITNTENSNTKYICVALENGTFEGLAEHIVTVTLKSGKQKTAVANIVTGKEVRNQIVPARPSTSVIGSN